MGVRPLAARATVEHGRPLAPWVYRVARNHCIDRLRARRQIAGTLGQPEGTVKYRLHELKRRLRKYMEDSA